ncbi:OLC1v1032402C1 [Oldenlandia corymbosa var. corymbosa]|uniref:OLC1v1032402C1 n=1 Tax=Oldenlandia corymbosa var. corymbosa TaxID=529605 RepID=A0AAV1CNU4_OLDCO|nr:OLC1v1032402C1 [Oldenlandia corymbosa var. corymbosa]
MVRPFPVDHLVQNFCSLPLAILGVFVSISVALAFCASHSKQYYLRKHSKNDTITTQHGQKIAAPSSLIVLSKRIIRSAGAGDKSNYKFSGGESKDDVHQQMIISGNPNSEEEFGEGGLWQKSILMGERCQPPQFSGVLFYDSFGNRISELPRSPRSLNHVQNHSS